jgi:hypothetical protein
MSFGRWIALLTLTLLPATALGQTPKIVPAPTMHAATKLSFPDQIGGANRTESVDYEKTFNEPGLGYSWHYLVPQTLSATVYLYSLGETSIPTGANGPDVLEQFQEALGQIPESKKYQQIAVLKGPTDCAFGAITFRCVVESCVVVSTRSADKLELLVTGLRNHFLKVRLDWHQNSPQGDAAAERFMQVLTSQVLR